jgi:hypothetical protein
VLSAELWVKSHWAGNWQLATGNWKLEAGSWQLVVEMEPIDGGRE